MTQKGQQLLAASGSAAVHIHSRLVSVVVLISDDEDEGTEQRQQQQDEDNKDDVICEVDCAPSTVQRKLSKAMARVAEAQEKLRSFDIKQQEQQVRLARSQ
jgi:hypothetical protein